MVRITFQLLVKLFHRLQQGVHMFKVMIMRHAPSHVPPDVFLWIQFGRVGWQPFKLNPVLVLLQQVANSFCFVRPVIVDIENDLALRMSRQLTSSRNGSQQTPKPNIVATMVDHRYRLACDRVHGTPVPALGCTHTGCQNDSLLADARPAASDCRKQTHLGRICKEENLLRAGFGLVISNAFFSLRRDPGLACA